MAAPAADTAAVQRFFAALEAALQDGRFDKLLLAGYRGAEPELQRLGVRAIDLRGQPHLSLVYSHARRDVTKNLPLVDGLALLRRLQSSMRQAWRRQNPLDLAPPWTDEISDSLTAIAVDLARVLVDTRARVSADGSQELDSMLTTLVGDPPETGETVRRLLALDVVQRTSGADLRGPSGPSPR